MIVLSRQDALTDDEKHVVNTWCTVSISVGGKVIYT